MKAKAHARLLSAFVLLAGLSAACDEDPPESAYDTPTPLESPPPGVTPVAITVPGDGTAVSSMGRIAAPGERDVFEMTLPSAAILRIDVDAQGGLGSANLDAQVTLFAPGGTVHAIADDGTNVWSPSTAAPGPLRDPYLVTEATFGGLYRAVVEDVNGAGDDTTGFDYRISFSLVQSTPLAGGLACADAVALPSLPPNGAIVSINAAINPASTDTCCNAQTLPCVGTQVASPDLTYTVNLTSGQTVQVSRSGKGFDGAVYLSDACTASDISIINGCVAGADGADDADGFVFTPAATGAYFLFVDGVSGSGGNFTLDVNVIP